MRKHWERQSNANSWRETVSVILGDRDIQERQRGEAERRGRKTHPQGREKMPGTVSRL